MSKFVTIRDVNKKEILVNIDQIFTFETDDMTEKEREQYPNHVVFFAVNHTGSAHFRVILEWEIYDDLKHRILTK